MSWRSYFWPCAFFFLLGVLSGFGSGAIAYKYRRPILRLPGRMVRFAVGLTKPSPQALVPEPIVSKDGSLILASFENADELRIFGDSDVKLERSTEQANRGQYSLKVAFPDGGGAIGTWRTLLANWSRYKRLRFDVYSMDPNIPLSLYIKDSRHTSYRQRYNKEGFRLLRGWAREGSPAVRRPRSRRKLSKYRTCWPGTFQRKRRNWTISRRLILRATSTSGMSMAFQPGCSRMFSSL